MRTRKVKGGTGFLNAYHYLRNRGNKADTDFSESFNPNEDNLNETDTEYDINNLTKSKLYNNINYFDKKILESTCEDDSDYCDILMDNNNYNYFCKNNKNFTDTKCDLDIEKIKNELKTLKNVKYKSKLFDDEAKKDKIESKSKSWWNSFSKKSTGGRKSKRRKNTNKRRK